MPVTPESPRRVATVWRRRGQLRERGQQGVKAASDVANRVRGRRGIKDRLPPVEDERCASDEVEASADAGRKQLTSFGHFEGLVRGLVG